MIAHPTLPDGLRLLWYGYDGAHDAWQVVASRDEDDAAFEGIGPSLDDALAALAADHAADRTTPEDEQGAHHPTVARMYDGERIDVDEGIAPLLDLAWRAGTATTGSCQGGAAPAMLGFPTADDAERFLEIAIGDDDPDDDLHSLAARVLRRDDPDPADWARHRRERGWRYLASPSAAPPLTLGIVAMFPSDDIPALTECLASDTEGEAT